LDWIEKKADEQRRLALQKELEEKKRILYCFDANSVRLVSTEGASTIHPETDEFTAVALIGDKFYKDKFVSMAELKRSYHTLEGTYHDINHWGTTYLDGSPNIEYVIGYNDNVKLNPVTKALTADIHVLKSAKNYSTWRGFVDVNKAIGRTPNVSVSFYSIKKVIKASNLPVVDLAAYGLKDNGDVTYLYDIEFQALSTVFKGACSDKDGCGIGMSYHQPAAELSESQLREKIRCIQLERKIKALGGR
jgi:hypothetical protein